MRLLVSHPAVQLRSVSHRYRARRFGSQAGEFVGTATNRGRTILPRGGDEDTAASQATRLTRLEAVLFLAREPLGSRKLAQLANLADGTEARTLMRRLNKQYDAEGRAFRVEEIAQGYHLLTRPKFAPWLRRLTGTDAQIRFSHPALETLAVVAYRQPVLRAEIESVRGVQCGEILRQLMERGMVRIVGRADELGRPMLYGTTRQFLQTFGLKHLEDLPRAEQLRRGDEPAENDDMRSEIGESEETSEMPLETDAVTSTAVVEHDGDVTEANALEENALGDEIFDEDLDEEDEENDDFDDDEDDDDLEDDEWEEVDDEDLDEDDDEDDDDLSDDDLNGDDWDDEDDDWGDGDDAWEDEEEIL